MMDEIWAVIGGGHGGQTFAGHMAMLGKRVRLHSKSKEKVDALNVTKCIELHHAIEGVGRIEFATTDIGKALKDATHVVMVLPSNWHRETTRMMAPYLRDGQFVLLLPEASCGAIAFRKALKDFGCTKKLIVGAAASLPYATRSIRSGVCHVSGFKSSMKIAALPASDNAKLGAAFCKAFPCFVLCKNVVETSIDSTNAMMHPAPTLLNVARIEAVPRQSYEYYRDGITPSVGALLEKMDAERIAVAQALGNEQRTLKQCYIDLWGCGDASMPLWRVIQNNEGYRGIMNLQSLKERPFTEDIPYSLVAISALGVVAGVKTPCIDAVCTLGRAILGEELDIGRTAENLGIAGMSREELIRYINGD